MRHASIQPGEQLRSVAARYCSPLAAGRAAGSIGKAVPVRVDRVYAVTSDQPTQDHSWRHDADLARLEAVLLLARAPANSRKLAQFANLADGTQARTLIRRINERYDAAGRAFRVEQVAGGFQLLTRRKFAPWLRRLAHVPGESRLSAPALETLSVVAYRQPVPRAAIEAIRGVNCGEILRQLMERDLVRIGGRSEELGRPFLYATTKRFLQVFGLIHLDDLPRGDLLRHAPLPVAGPSVTIFAGPASAELDAEGPAVDEGPAEPDTSGEIRIETEDE
jgi:segregation and condensation protein B